MKKKFLFFIWMIGLAMSIKAQDIAAYSGTSTPTAVAVANATATPLSRGPSINSVVASTYSSRHFSTNSTISMDHYIQWAITASSGYIININSLQINYDRDVSLLTIGGGGPRQVALRSSADSFTNNLYTNTDVSTIPTTTSVSMLLSSSPGGTITFRLYGYDALLGALGGNEGTLDIEGALGNVLGVSNTGIRLIGTVTYDGLVYNNDVWTPSAPTASTGTTNVLIQNSMYNVTTAITANNVTVNSGAGIDIDKTANMTVNGNLITSNNVTLNSDSDEYSSLITYGIVTGTVNYSRHVNGQPGIGVGTGANDLISAPVSGQTFAAFAGNNPNLKFDPSNTTRKLFGPFNKATGSYLTWDTSVNGGEILTAGVGYRAASNDNGGFLFIGTINTGNVTYNIVNAGPYFATYNLIGNPYPSYINVREFLEYDVDPSAATVRNIDLMAPNNAAIYGYDGDASGDGGDGWIVYNLNTPTYINMAPGQGFLVTADGADVTAYDITFTPSMRRIGNTDDFIPGRMTDTDNKHLRLQASIGPSTCHTDFYFNENSTSGMDVGYDAAVFGSEAPAKSIYSHLVENNMGADMAIQSLAFSDLGSDIVIPLGINVPQGQQATVSIQESSLPNNYDIYLEDTVTNTITLLNTGNYNFIANTTLNSTGRFFLHFTDATLSTPEILLNPIEIYATNMPRALCIKGHLESVTTLSMYDVQGREVLKTTLDPDTTTHQLEISGLISGVYVIQLNNRSQHNTQKVVIK